MLEPLDSMCKCTKYIVEIEYDNKWYVIQKIIENMERYQYYMRKNEVKYAFLNSQTFKTPVFILSKSQRHFSGSQ